MGNHFNDRMSGSVARLVSFFVISVMMISVGALYWYARSDKQSAHYDLASSVAPKSADSAFNPAASPTQSLQAQASNSGVASESSMIRKPGATSAGLNATIVVIPELGFKLTLPDTVKNLTYTSDQITLLNGIAVTQVFFYGPKISSSDPICSASSLGVLTRVEGQYPTNDPVAVNLYGSLAKQFSTYFIAYARPQGVCSQKDQSFNNRVAADQKDFLSAARKGDRAE